MMRNGRKHLSPARRHSNYCAGLIVILGVEILPDAGFAGRDFVGIREEEVRTLS